MKNASTISPLIEQIHSQLIDIEQAFGLPKDTLADWERQRELIVLRTTSGDTFEQYFSLDRIISWFDCFGDDLLITVTISDDERADEQHHINKQSLANYDAVLSVLRRYEIDRVSTVCTLAKSHLGETLGTLCNAHFDGLYFFSQALEQNITLNGVEVLFKTDVLHLERHSLIGILESDGQLQGPYITIVGRSYLANLGDQQTQPVPYVGGHLQRWANARSLRDSSATWEGFLKIVDPIYFNVKQSGMGLVGVYGKMNYLSSVLAILQFCTSVMQADGLSLRATIAKPLGTTIHVALAGSTNDTPAITEHDLSAVRRTFIWAFTGNSYDKADIVRDLIEREVRAEQSDVVPHLQRTMPRLLESARATYKILRMRAFETYLQARAEATRKVSDFVEASRGSIDKLRNDMITRVLQFFAAIVAYLAVSVFQPGLPAFYKHIGIALGIMYIVLIGIFQMTPTLLDYRTKRDEAEKAVRAQGILTPTEQKDIISQLPSGFWTSFMKWFIACGVVYGLGIASLVIALIAM